MTGVRGLQALRFYNELFSRSQRIEVKLDLKLRNISTSVSHCLTMNLHVLLSSLVIFSPFGCQSVPEHHGIGLEHDQKASLFCLHCLVVEKGYLQSCCPDCRQDQVIGYSRSSTAHCAHVYVSAYCNITRTHYFGCPVNLRSYTCIPRTLSSTVAS